MGKTEVAIAVANSTIGALEKSTKSGRQKSKTATVSSNKIMNVVPAEDVGYKILPQNVNFFTNQVAGHMYDGKSIGLLKQKDGTVLKPLIKDMCGEREMRFYEELESTRDSELLALKKFVAGYHGTKKLALNGKEVSCIALDDLTEGYKEPCIMDVKIGRRTWDPLATYEKIANEDKKYMECKRDLGFCITGFQVYKINDGRLCKYGKEYGKVLNKNTVKDALKNFLNSETGLNRNLLVQLLVPLWRIQHWFRSQRKIRLYSSSLLLVYDAHRLRHYQSMSPSFANITPSSSSSSLSSQQQQQPQRVARPISVAVFNNDDQSPKTGFSGQLTPDGPLLSSPAAPLRKQQEFAYPSSSSSSSSSAATNSSWKQCLKKLKRTHSFTNNYDRDLQSFKDEYASILNDLVTSDKGKQVWASVKMIDFAHVFPAENNEVDKNYLDGIENLVKILEGFLEETNLS